MNEVVGITIGNQYIINELINVDMEKTYNNAINIFLFFFNTFHLPPQKVQKSFALIGIICDKSNIKSDYDK